MPNKVTAGQAYVSLLTDNKALVNGLKVAYKHVETFTKTANEKVAEFGKGMKSFGLKTFGGGLAALGLGFKSSLDFAKTGDDLSKMSQRLGTTTEFLSEMGYAAKMSGADLGAMKSAIGAMKEKGLDGSLYQFGIDPSQMTVEKQFDAIINRLSLIKSDTIRAAMATKVFGSAGTDLIPMLKAGTKGIESMRKEAKALGISMSGEDAQSAVTFTKAWTRLTETFKATKNMIGVALAPMFSDLMDRMTPIIANIGKWIMANKPLIVTIMKIAAGVTVLGGVMMGLGITLVGVANAFGVIGSVIGGVSTVFSTILSVVGFLLSPIGLLTAAIVGLVGYFLYSSGVLGKSVDWLKDRFSGLLSFASEVFGGIRDAIMAGDLALAFEIAWAAIKMVWIKGKNWILDQWYAIKYGVLEIWSSVVYGLALGWENLVAGLQSAWTNFTAFLKKTWTNVTSELKTVWAVYKTWWQKQMNYITGKMMGVDDKTIESMNKADDANLSHQIIEIETAKQAAMGSIEFDRKTRVDQVEAERKAMTEGLKAAQNADRDERTKKHANALTAMQKEENDARAKLQSLNEKAAAQMADFEKNNLHKNWADGILDGLNLSAGGKSSGTFSAFEIGSLGNDIQKKQLDELTAIRIGIDQMSNAGIVR